MYYESHTQIHWQRVEDSAEDVWVKFLSIELFIIIIIFALSSLKTVMIPRKQG